ncbi:UNKNOWN [Stylonychia lemnae]|uniref:Uncharacterized protein n=1 Tax=Stylonychia lemnae TaxID=5949 RepID=A0A078AGC5_STYLE|nr:UNKNOWN [Stylonychia lemnae]|eukprot:CDW81289.1 UNKNOWN [Stylonychia lemnae]
MGNRTGCGMFEGTRVKNDKYWIKEFSDIENRTVKELYYQMKVIRKEIDMAEFKRLLHMAITNFRRTKKLTDNLEFLYDYIQVIIDRDISNAIKFRISMEEFYMLWHQDEQGIEFQSSDTAILATRKDKGGLSCLECLVCPPRKGLNSKIENTMHPNVRDIKRGPQTQREFYTEPQEQLIEQEEVLVNNNGVLPKRKFSEDDLKYYS